MVKFERGEGPLGWWEPTPHWANLHWDSGSLGPSLARTLATSKSQPCAFEVPFHSPSPTNARSLIALSPARRRTKLDRNTLTTCAGN
ncbi:hypothetical protein QC763_0055130 [Podospora pseudopauciseta]|uniref:Uncharacterized protein n=1 Tax=Podospora pseudopauciseta TaxID=2093780 RepID=A0ABR0HH59_9PEZI|nr:hypothetical protein QC763_0055130 [Podospora pseudopauciseta]